MLPLTNYMLTDTMPGTCTLLKGGMWSPFRGLVKKRTSESLN